MPSKSIGARCEFRQWTTDEKGGANYIIKQGLFHEWGIKDNSTVAIIEECDTGVCHLVRLGEFKFVNPYKSFYKEEE